MALPIFLSIIVFVALMEAAIPYLVKKSVVFGVTIPEGYRKDEKLVSFKKWYSFIVLFLSIIALIIFSLWGTNSQPSQERIVLFGVAIQFSIIFVSMALYFYFHAKTVQRKKEQKWGENLKQVKITDLLVRSQDEMLQSYMFLLPMVITLGVIGYTVSLYSTLPEQIPTHWGPDGKPDAFTEKSPFSVISLPLILLAMQGMFLGINEMTKRSGIKLSATSTEASKIRQLSLRKYSSWFMFLMAVLVTLFFSFLQFTTIHKNMVGDAILFTVPMLFMFIVLIGSIVFAVKVSKADDQIGDYKEGAITDFDEDQFWRGGLFYFNKNDPSIFVEKRFGVGWTINFANPRGYLIIFGPLFIILLVSYLGS